MVLAHLVGSHVGSIGSVGNESTTAGRLAEFEDSEAATIDCQRYSSNTDEWVDVAATTLSDVDNLSLVSTMSQSAASTSACTRVVLALRKMPIPAFTLTSNLHVYSWNDHAEEALGWSETDLVHDGLPLHSSDEVVFESNCIDVIENNCVRKVNIKIRTDRRDTQEVSCSLVPIADHNRHGAVLGVITDIYEAEGRLKSIHGALDRINSATSRDELLTQTVEQVDRLVHPSYAALFIADGDRLSLEAKTGGAVERFGSDPSITPEQTHLWDAFERDEMEYVPDLGRVDVRETDIRSELLLPLDGYGLLAVGSTTRRAFRRPERELLNAYADVVTTNLRHFERNELLHSYKARVQRLSRDLETATTESLLVQEVVTALQTSRDRKAFAQAVCDLLVDRWEVTFASYYDAGPDGLGLQAWAESSQGDVRLHDLDAVDWFVSEAFESQTLESARDEFVERSDSAAAFETRAIPVTFRDRRAGVLLVGDSQQEGGLQRGRQFSQTLGRLIGLSLEAIDPKRTWMLADWEILDLRVERDMPLTRLASALNETVELSSVSMTPDALSLTFSVSVPATEARATIRRTLETSHELTVESIDGDATCCELRTKNWGLNEFRSLQEFGARIVSGVATDEAFHCRLEVPASVSVEEICDGCGADVVSVSVENSSR